MGIVKHPTFSHSSETLPLLRSELNILTTNCNETIVATQVIQLVACPEKEKTWAINI